MQPGMMPSPYAPQPNLEHLRLLSIFHYVMGGIVGVFSLFPIIHLGMGIAIVSGALPTSGGSGPPAVMGWTFIIIGGTVILFGETLAICTLLAGRYLSTRQAWLFCVIVAGMSCLNMPFGTVLGVFTILTLVKPEVKALFDQR
jgi:hypothetical protein